MASSKEFIDFVSDQVASACDDIRYRKMFGDYMLYCAGRPVFLVCDDTVYVKQIPETMAIFSAHGVSPDAGVPYNGARPHWILDIENIALSVDMARELARVLPLPRPKKKPTPKRI